MNITVAAPWFKHIKKGRKTVEGRLNKGKFSELGPGSVLVIAEKGSHIDKVVAVVVKVKKYPDFKTYLVQEGLASTLPGITSIEEGVAVYRRFYSEEQEKEYGVLAICIHVVNDKHSFIHV